MTESSDIKTPFSPVFLKDEERGSPSGEGTQSIDEPKSVRDEKLSPGTFIEYPANIQDLRLLVPYAADLKKHLGPTCHVLQILTPFSYDSVPNEWKRKASPLLWEIKIPGSSGFVTDRDPRTFYFRTPSDSETFIRKMNGADSSGPSLEEVLNQRDRLRKLLG